MTEKTESQSGSSERRSSSRRRILFPGLIVYGSGTFTCDCSFRSLSATGARISIAAKQQFGGRFYVINIRDGIAYDAQVIWNKGSEVGIKFESAISLSTNTDLGFSRLKNLWLAKRTF
jgi:hypothetical protein